MLGGQPDQFQFKGIPVLVDAVDARVQPPVEQRRGDVAAAGKEQPVEAFQQAGEPPVFMPGRDDDRRPTGRRIAWTYLSTCKFVGASAEIAIRL